ncbi:MAG: UDP-N-acetylmuramate--L-alanine ligase [Leptolyngbyaceae bacterium]|nr:UDP-N-acetylmuramate--L-alanine ligase [Leptolyngbyaceae bacterium]
MLDSVDLNGRPFHFIGIGGIGMSALAYVLTKRNLPVSGSDLHLNHITQRLEDLGAHIFGKQEAANLACFQTEAKSEPQVVPHGMDGDLSSLETKAKSPRQSDRPVNSPGSIPQVIVSTAVNSTNAEYQAAIALGCPVFHRSDLLAALMQAYQSIAVAGTHGKTTTSSLIGHMLLQSGLDPTIIVGGEVKAWEGNARLGQSPYLVAEADESDGSLVKLVAQIGIVTNIELDHPDHYDTLDDVIQTFQTFAAQCQTLVGCIDCSTVRDRLQPSITYSLHPESGADYTVDSVTYGANGTLATVWERGSVLGQLNLQLLGRHNLSNALAAIAVGRQLGLDFATIAQAISTFEGARRRFELRGECNHILFIDDYAHHPSEIQATLAAARLHIQKEHIQKEHLDLTQRRVVAIFQPHRYSRTLAFLSEFARSFSDADIVVVTDIYSAGEPNLGKVSGQQVVELIGHHHPHVSYQASLQSVSAFLSKTLRPGDLALFLGAGNLNQIIPEVMTTYATDRCLATTGSNPTEATPKSLSLKVDPVMVQG